MDEWREEIPIMSFTSHIFVFYFLPILLLCCYLIPQSRNLLWKVFLIVASYAFYAWLNPLFVALLFCTTLFNYVLSKSLADSNGRGRCLSLAIVCVAENLCLLGFFHIISPFLNLQDAD